jgi:hypothetical protein
MKFDPMFKEENLFIMLRKGFFLGPPEFDPKLQEARVSRPKDVVLLNANQEWEARLSNRPLKRFRNNNNKIISILS